MATGFDELIEFILSEIALCGTQGAGSADFRRFIQTFYNNKHVPGGLGPKLYQRLWEWVNDQGDVRILYKKETRKFSLQDFEALELQEAGINASENLIEQPPKSYRNKSLDAGQPRTAVRQYAFRNSLRQRLQSEGHAIANVSAPKPIATDNIDVHLSTQERLAMVADREEAASQELSRTSENAVDGPVDVPDMAHLPKSFHNHRPDSKKRGRRKNIPMGKKLTGHLFDDPPFSVAAPRLYASQNRIWHAVAGHSIDLKRLPSMEFVLLSIIAAHGPSGVTQPELVRISGQDKRSVPHRTDELAKKGYIEKKPMQAHKVRTSLCVHKRFVLEGHFLKGPGVVGDVFRNKTFILSGFANLLYNLLKDVGIIAMRDLRRRLGVSTSEWTPRAVRNAILRLDETGFIKRVRARKKGSKDVFLVCIKLIRPPNEDDIKNLNFRRRIIIPENSDSPEVNPLESDEEGDDVERDLELDIAAEVDSDDIDRIPPQWTPDRLIANLLVGVTDMAGPDGVDSEKLYGRVVGKFWKRPLESYVGRLTDHWEQSQPLHLRHLAIVRDTAVTSEKRFLHYVYRTHPNFQKAVDEGQLTWEAVSKEATRNTPAGKPNHSEIELKGGMVLNSWGFLDINIDELLQPAGSSTLAECRESIDRGARQGPHWDNALAQELGYKKYKKTGLKYRPTVPHPELMTREQYEAVAELKRLQRHTELEAARESDQGFSTNEFERPRKLRQQKPEVKTAPLISKEQRIALGLPPKGRLGAGVEDQIREHREKTGNPFALPSIIVSDPPPPRHAPLLTREERLAQGLSALGRLPKAVEKRIRQERGMALAAERIKKGAKKRQPRLLSKEERIARGLPGTGRLSRSVIDEILRERRMAGSSTPSDTLASTELDPDEDATGSALTGAQLVEESVPTSNSAPISLEASPQIPPNDDTSNDFHGSVHQFTGAVSMKRSADNLSYGSQPATKKIRAKLTHSTNVGPRPALRNGASSAIGEQAVLSSVENPTVPQITTEATNRTDPGVYLSRKNPFTPPGPGRPKKVLMATFKSTRLLDMVWFQSTTSTVHESSVSRSVEFESTRQAREFVSVINPAAEMSPVGTPHDQNYQRDESEQNGDDNSLNRRDHANHSRSPSIVTAIEVSEVDPRDAVPSSNIELQASRTTEICAPQMPSWNAINKSPANQPYRSPYAAIPMVQPPVQTQTTGTEGVSTSTAVSTTSISIPGSPIPYTAVLIVQSPVQTHTTTGPKSASTSVAVSTASASVPGSPFVTDNDRDASYGLEIPTGPEPSAGPALTTRGDGQDKKKSKGLKSSLVTGRGNVWRLRVSILRDIIDRCNGIYPANGEIWEPFVTLWAQRAPKIMIRPDRSTVTTTLQSLSTDPEYSLKKLAFVMPGVDGTNLIKRAIFARGSISPTGPEVRKLQQDIMRAYPRRFFPDEIRHLVTEETAAKVPFLQPEIDLSVEVNGLYPATAKKLDQRIRESAKNRKMETAKKKEKVVKKRKTQTAEVEKTAVKRSQPRLGVRAKPTRLASLNDAPRVYTRANLVPPLSKPSKIRESSPARSESSEDIPLSILRPLQPKSYQALPTDEHLDNENISFDEDEVERRDVSATLVNPAITFYSSNGTFSTDFAMERDKKSTSRLDTVKAVTGMPDEALHQAGKGRKRVRIAEELPVSPRKKPRIDNSYLDPSKYDKYLGPDKYLNSTFFDPSDDEVDEYVLDSSSSDDDEVGSEVHLRRGKPSKGFVEEPTLVQRLTGLTGNPDDPIYVPPVKKSRPRPFRYWAHADSDKEIKTRKVTELLDSVDKFKKLCFALVIASSMSGEDGVVDWDIVTSVYSSDKKFKLAKVKKMWTWMQNNMASQLEALSTTFQSSFIDAYEKGRIASIEDPATYDWAGLVQWALRKCKYSEPSLLFARDFHECEVDESIHNTFDHVDWHKKDLSHVIRTSRLLSYAYADHLHPPSGPKSLIAEDALRARSWIRANTSTPQAIYDGKKAHDKLSELGLPVLERGVTELVDESVLRMRKIKRLLPGRNYSFMAALALQYRRAFEVEDFIDGADFKKTLDGAFANEDEEQRSLSISRTATNGAVMALLSMVNEGSVRLVPKLPQVNNTFNAPLPRLSVWGFSEGDYINRSIDRNRLFWDIDAVPTSSYQFGNPLSPSTRNAATWVPVVEPPLPGKTDAQSLLPIWSSIDGQTITWPWWNRILNLVLQSIMFQPGISISEIHHNCPTSTAELFEVELTVSWLLDVKAIQKTTPDTFEVLPGFWAAFGDRLIDKDDDWFGKHVKRKKVSSGQWRAQYNAQFAALNDEAAPAGTSRPASGEADVDVQPGQGESTTQRIIQNPRHQYRVIKEKAVKEKVVKEKVVKEKVVKEKAVKEKAVKKNVTRRQAIKQPAKAPSAVLPALPPTPQAQSAQDDVIMVDSDVDADGDIDMDAEGEPDDELI